MKNIVYAALLLISAFLAGCATHANIKTPVLAPVNDAAYTHKSMSYDVLYSQPEPGLLMAGGDRLPLKPLNQSKVSVAAAATLQHLPDYIFDQLPATMTRAVDAADADYNLRIKLVAHDKKGPAYGDFKFGASLAKSVLTLGLGSDEYAIVADFDVTYQLMQDGLTLFEKSYKVNDSVPHERGAFKFKNDVNRYASALFEKHLKITLHDFFAKAAPHIDSNA